MLGAQTAETLSPSPGSWNPQMEEVGGARPPGLAPWPGDVGPSPCVLTQSSPVCVCILIVSPYKDTSYQIRVHLTTFLPGSPLKGPLSRYSHIPNCWGLVLQHVGFCSKVSLLFRRQQQRKDTYLSPRPRAEPAQAAQTKDFLGGEGAPQVAESPRPSHKPRGRRNPSTNPVPLAQQEEDVSHPGASTHSPAPQPRGPFVWTQGVRQGAGSGLGVVPAAASVGCRERLSCLRGDTAKAYRAHKVGEFFY